MTDNLYHINFGYDYSKLLNEALDESEYSQFVDPLDNKVFDFWKIKKVNSGYGKEISDYFVKILQCEIRPRFYIQVAKSDLGWHVDRGTQCSINFVLSDIEDPVSFKDGDYTYKTALLNVQNEHAVLSPKSDRILFKLSIADKPYHQIKQRLIDNLK